jgi:hypothetical protein
VLGRLVEDDREWAALRHSGAADVDYAAWAASPLVHQSDDDVLLENAAAARSVAQTLRERGARVVIGPVSLERPTFPHRQDLRAERPIMGPFVAGLVHAASMGGAHTVIVSLPTILASGDTTSAGRVLQWLSVRSGTPLVTIEGTPPRVRAFALRGADDELVVCNESPEERTVAMADRWHRLASSLDPGSTSGPGDEEVVLAPYEVVLLRAASRGSRTDVSSTRSR